MKTMINRWAWVIVAILAVGLTACSKDDEPQPVPQPDPGTEQEDPNGDNGNNPVENWEDEKPHGFYFDIDSIYMPLTDDGFLMIKDGAGYKNAIVIEKKYGYPTKDRAKEGSVRGVMHGTPMYLKGKRATPWTNVDKYIELFRILKIRPDSRFCTFPELADLPVRDISRFGMFTLETLVSVDVITHKRFNKDIPAESSMRGTGMGADDSGDVLHPVGITYCIADYDYTLEVIQGGATSFGHEIGRLHLLGRYPKKLLFPGIDLCIHGYPEEAGEYPMTLRMEFANGTVLTKDFKIRFVNEE